MRKYCRCIANFVLPFLIYLFALLYPHMNAKMFWCETFEYFHIGSLGNNFIFSTEMGLMWMVIPTCALIGTNASKSKRRPLQGNSSIWCDICALGDTYLHVILPFISAMIIFCFILILSSRRDTTGSWQITAMSGAYGWRSQNEFIFVYITECIMRVCSALLFWVTVNETIQLFTTQKATVFVTVNIVNICIDCYFSHIKRPELSISNLAIPSIVSSYPLKNITKGLMVYIAVGFFLYGIAKQIDSRLKRTKWYKKEPIDSISLPSQIPLLLCQGFSPSNTILVVAMPIIINVLYQGKMFETTSIVDAWLNYFGGLGWGTPEINPYQVLLWMLSLSPIIAGFFRIYAVAESAKSSLSAVSIFSVYVTLILYIVACFIIELFLVSVIAISSGAKRFWMIYVPDGVNQIQLVVYLVFIPFLSLMIKSTLFIALLLISGSKGVTGCSLIIPDYLMLLLGSNEDIMSNIYLPASWGMIIRSSLFSPTSVVEYTAEDVFKEYQLASFDVNWGMSALLLLYLFVACLLFAAIIRLWYVKKNKPIHAG